MIPEAIGRHRIAVRGDLIDMCFHGPIVTTDLYGLREVMVLLIQDCGRCFLIADLTDSHGIESDARKYMAEWSKQRTDRVAGTAVFGVNFAMRAIIQLTLNAIKFLGQQQVDLVFVRDAAEARRWIDAQRAVLFPGGEHVVG